jgi:hypothetical protein
MRELRARVSCLVSVFVSADVFLVLLPWFILVLLVLSFSACLLDSAVVRLVSDERLSLFLGVCNGRVAARVRVTDHDCILRWSLGRVLLDSHILHTLLPPTTSYVAYTSRASYQLRVRPRELSDIVLFLSFPHSSSYSVQ